VCLPNVRTAGSELRVLTLNPGDDESIPIPQSVVEERLVTCCCDALPTCTGIQTEQVLLHSVFMITIQKLLSPSVGTVLSEHLQERIGFVVNHILTQLSPMERSVELTLTRFAILRGYLAVHAKYGDVESCVKVVQAVCHYIEGQVQQPPFRQTKSLHTMILAAYNCLAYVFTVMPMVVSSTDALRDIVRAVALGLTGSVLDEPEVNPEWSITPSGPRRLFSSRFLNTAHVSTRSPSFRVQEAAVTLFNHLLATNQQPGIDASKSDELLASEHGFPPEVMRYFVMDEQAIICAVVPKSEGPRVDCDRGILLIIRDDVGKYIWQLGNARPGGHLIGPATTPSRLSGSGYPRTSMDSADGSAKSAAAAAAPPPPGGGGAASSAAEALPDLPLLDEETPSPDTVIPTITMSDDGSPDVVLTPKRARFMSAASLDFPAASSSLQRPPAEPLPDHTAASLKRFRDQLTAAPTHSAVSKAWDSQIRDDEAALGQGSPLGDAAEGEGGATPPLRSLPLANAVDVSPIAFLAHLGGLQPNTDDKTTPMGRFREIVCDGADVADSIAALDDLTYDTMVDVIVVCLKPDGDCAKCYPTRGGSSAHLPEKFVEFFALLCQSAPGAPHAKVGPHRFVWETVVLNVQPRDELPDPDESSDATQLAVVWAANSTQLTAMSQRIQVPAIIVCPLPDGLYLTSVYSGAERAPALLMHAIPLSGRILHEMMCRAIANLALELVWGTLGHVFPHNRRQKMIQTMIKTLAPIARTTSALHEYIASNMAAPIPSAHTSA